jgi:hypothetical protein
MKHVIRLAVLVLTALSCGSCGGASTSPSEQPVPKANLQITGQGSWTSCVLGDCFFSASIQNTGTGCASGTTLVARIFDSANAQVGSDIQMGGSGASLSGMTIRPNEVVAVTSIARVSSQFIARTSTYRLAPTWNDVRCP